jgi:hypothetical protein
MSTPNLEAYNRILESGALGRLQLVVLEVIATHGPITTNEIVEEHLASRGCRHNSIAPRVLELKRMGVIYAFDERPCRFNGNKASAWELSGNPPEKIITEGDDCGPPEEQDPPEMLKLKQLVKDKIEELKEARGRIRWLEGEVSRLSMPTGGGKPRPSLPLFDTPYDSRNKR